MMELESKKYWKTVAAVFITVTLIAVLVYMFAILPLKSSLNGLKAQLNKKQTELKAAEAASSPQSKKANTRKLAEIEQLITTFAVTPSQLAEITFNLGRLADQAGVKDYAGENMFNSLQKDAAIQGLEKLALARLKVSFDCDYPAFARFVNMLERNNPVIFIDEFNIRNEPRRLCPTEMVVSFYVADYKPQTQTRALPDDCPSKKIASSETEPDTQMMEQIK
jgi:lipoprotein NlpI